MSRKIADRHEAVQQTTAGKVQTVWLKPFWLMEAIYTRNVYVRFCVVLCLCRDPGDCPSLVLVLLCCIGSRFVVREGQRWLPDAEKGVVDPG